MKTVSERQMPLGGSTLVPEGRVYPDSEADTTRTSPKRLARIAGLLYLLVGIFGGFAQGFLYPRIYVAGDAAKTAENLVEHSGLVRAGVVADLFQSTVWVCVAMTLYVLLKHVNTSVARAMVVFAGEGIRPNMTLRPTKNLKLQLPVVSSATGSAALADARYGMDVCIGLLS